VKAGLAGIGVTSRINLVKKERLKTVWKHRLELLGLEERVGLPFLWDRKVSEIK
jgi:hypothetical protein